MTRTYPPDQRAAKIDSAYFLAVLYTIGYLALMSALMVSEIPPGNKDLLLTLSGIMSAAQLGIIKHYYDGTKAAEATQQASVIGRAQADAAIQSIAKNPPTIIAPVNGGTIKAEDVKVEAAGDVTIEDKKI